MYMGMAAILINDAEPFEQIVNTLSTESPMWNLVKIAQTVLEKTFKKKMAAAVAILDFITTILAIFDLEVILLLLLMHSAASDHDLHCLPSTLLQTTMG